MSTPKTIVKTIVVEYVGTSEEEQKKLQDALNEKFKVVRRSNNFFEIAVDDGFTAILQQLKKDFYSSGRKFTGRIVDYDPSPHVNCDFVIISC